MYTASIMHEQLDKTALLLHDLEMILEDKGDVLHLAPQLSDALQLGKYWLCQAAVERDAALRHHLHSHARKLLQRSLEDIRNRSMKQHQFAELYQALRFLEATPLQRSVQ